MLIRWLVHAVALVLVAALFPHIHVTGFGAALLGALVISILNTFLAPFLHVFAIPITILTFGFFALVINGFLFWLASEMLSGFDVRGPWTAIFGSLVYTLLSHGILQAIGRGPIPRRG